MRLVCTDVYNSLPDQIRSLEEIRIIMNYLSEFRPGLISKDKEFDKMFELRKKIIDKLTESMKSV